MGRRNGCVTVLVEATEATMWCSCDALVPILISRDFGSRSRRPTNQGQIDSFRVNRTKQQGNPVKTLVLDVCYAHGIQGV